MNVDFICLGFWQHLCHFTSWYGWYSCLTVTSFCEVLDEIIDELCLLAGMFLCTWELSV